MDILTILSTAAKKMGVTPTLLIAVCGVESNLKNVHNMNDKGSPSYGVCQVKYETVRWMAQFYEDREMASWTSQDLRIPSKNAEAAAKYLKYQLERYDGNEVKAIAAYNSGSYIESERFPGLPKNLKYVRKVQRSMERENGKRNP